MTDLPTVSVRAVPFAAGLHRGMISGPFVLLSFPRNGDGQPSEPDTVYMDGFTGDLCLDRAREIERYATAFDALQAAALDPAATRELIHRAVKEHGP